MYSRGAMVGGVWEFVGKICLEGGGGGLVWYKEKVM